VEPRTPEPAVRGSGVARRRAGLVLGPTLFLLMLLLPAPAGMDEAAARTAAVGLLMAVWWVTEAIPIPATALLPLALFPTLGVAGFEAAAAPYANPLIFLFMGGFMLALAMQRWGLHRRIALAVIGRMGTGPTMLVGGFMVASAGLSAWVSNTATVVMMLPIGISVIELVERRDDADGETGGPGAAGGFGTALMLGIAYAASIGGLATLIGTPPNALLAGFMREAYGVEIGFGEWMQVGVPLVLVTLPLAWLALTRVLFRLPSESVPGSREAIHREIRGLGPLARPEKIVAAVFTLAALAWVFRPLLERWLPGAGLSDPGIAIAAALALFLLPAGPRGAGAVLNWEWAARLPWDVLLLFGGGLSLAAAIQRSGLAAWIGDNLAALGAWPAVAVVLAVTVTIVLLTELTSNTATAAAFLPVAGALAIGIGENPLLLVVPTALAASCAFMMPVATPPNAIVYGSGRVSIPEMARAGLLLNLLFITAITLLAYTLVALVFAVEPGVVPGWAVGR